MPPARRGEIWLVDLGMVQKTWPVVILSVSFLDHGPLNEIAQK